MTRIVSAGGLGPEHIDHKVSFRPYPGKVVAGKLATVEVQLGTENTQAGVMIGLYAGFEFYSVAIDTKVTVHG